MPMAADTPRDLSTDTPVAPITGCMLPCLPAFCNGAVQGEGVRHRTRPAWSRGATGPWATPHPSLDVPQGGAWRNGRAWGACAWTRGGPPGLPHVHEAVP